MCRSALCLHVLAGAGPLLALLGKTGLYRSALNLTVLSRGTRYRSGLTETWLHSGSLRRGATHGAGLGVRGNGFAGVEFRSSECRNHGECGDERRQSGAKQTNERTPRRSGKGKQVDEPHKLRCRTGHSQGRDELIRAE